MNLDPLLVGTNSVFPNQNSSSAPTQWDEDTVQAAQQGLPCAPGPMLALIKRSSDQQFLPGGAVNPARETAPTCLAMVNEQTTAAGTRVPSLAVLASGLVGGQCVGGTNGLFGLGVVGVGAPGDGVRGVATGQATGHGVAGFTVATSPARAGVFGEARSGGVGVLGHCIEGSGIGVHGRGSSQAVRGDGGQFGLVGAANATGVDGTGTGATSFGVVGRGTAVGSFGRGVGAGTFGMIGVGGTVGVRGDGRGDTSGIGVEGIPGPFNGMSFPWAGAFRGGVLVSGNLFVQGSLSVSGGKAALVAHPDGTSRQLYAVESPESWFEDLGRSSLRDGSAWIDVDPDFASVSRLADDYHVFLTPEGPCQGLYVGERTPIGFEVRELGEGTSWISFSYRIVVRRPDLSVKRLQPVEMPSPEGEKAPAQSPEVRSPAPSLVPMSPPSIGDAGQDPTVGRGDSQGRPPSGWPTETVPWPIAVPAEIDLR